MGRGRPAGRRRDRQPGRPGPAGDVTDFVELPHWPPFNLADCRDHRRRLLLVFIYLREAERERDEWLSRSCGSSTSTTALAVVDKPAGLVVHPAPSHNGPTLVDELADILGGGADPERPGIVHRLDKGTSGLLVVARDDEAHAALQAQVQRREVERVYLALAGGRLGSRTGTIDAPIGRAARQRHRMAVSGAASRQARTHFEVLELLPRRATWRRAWRPAAPTRSAPTSPRSATR